jgi:TetR/AcrR family transcriptional regulator, cholesterol catabolism regulator
MAIFGMVNWIYKWYHKVGRYSVPEIADIFAYIVLHSVLLPEAKEKLDYSKFFLGKNLF